MAEMFKGIGCNRFYLVYRDPDRGCCTYTIEDIVTGRSCGSFIDHFDKETSDKVDNAVKTLHDQYCNNDCAQFKEKTEEVVNRNNKLNRH